MGKKEDTTKPGAESAESTFWRSPGELADSDEHRLWLEDEFPHRRSLADIDRRDFVKLMGASALMASLAGCRNLPREKIVPFVQMPEGRTPGIYQRYATSIVFGGYAFGVVAESREGRPGKIDGNPLHSSTLGKSDHFMQAALYDVFDPDRAQSVTYNKGVSNWDAFVKDLRQSMKGRGGRIRFLTGAITSPTTRRLMGRLLAKYPNAKWHQYEPFGDHNVVEGAKAAFGSALQPVYHFDQADVVVSIDADFLASGAGHVRYAADFSKRRKVDSKTPNLNRLYSAHTFPSVTSASSDHWVAIKPSDLMEFVSALANEVGASPAGNAGELTPFARSAAKDLMESRGRSIVLCGEHMPPEAHALAFAMNSVLGNIGSTVDMIPQLTAMERPSLDSVRELVEDMRRNRVDILICSGTNPVYSLPKDIDFESVLIRVGLTASHVLIPDETSHLLKYTLPKSHELESWGDALAFDGTKSLIQPLIAPLYDSKTLDEILEIVLEGTASGRKLVRDTHASALAGDAWEKALQVGYYGNAAQPAAARLKPFSFPKPVPSTARLEVCFLPDPNVFDGRGSNNAWLQELPKPISTLTWDNAIYMSPSTARVNGLSSENVVELTVGEDTVTGPVFALPSMADDTIVIHAGYGRTAGGTVAIGSSASLPDARHRFGVDTVGFDAMPISNAAFGAEASIKKVAGKWGLATVQQHHVMDGKDMVRSGDVGDLAKNPNLAPPHAHVPEEVTLYDQTTKDSEGQPYRWAMTIDLSLCIGCNACTIACQAENNIPVVGKEQVARGREMHWIRVDRYYAGTEDNPTEIVHQPVPCMHCELAPCEPVCPVAATTHSKEGLNQMIYNRCVGTRYCSNNCPYKVRRFNFLNYGDKVDKAQIRLINNPNVSVRGRGVMEKCTFCVQRINQARIRAKKESRTIKDGEVITACQQACPTSAIVFGNLNDPESQVSVSKKDPRNYSLLPELNTRPRTTYLGRVRNPNRDLAPKKAAVEEQGGH